MLIRGGLSRRPDRSITGNHKLQTTFPICMLLVTRAALFVLLIQSTANLFWSNISFNLFILPVQLELHDLCLHFQFSNTVLNFLVAKLLAHLLPQTNRVIFFTDLFAGPKLSSPIRNHST